MAVTKEETCEYIRDTVAVLAEMAKAADMTVLAYTLSMARLEAAAQLVGPEAGSGSGAFGE